MIVTLILNPKTRKNDKTKVQEITDEGINDISRSSMILMNLTGARPAYLVDSKGNFNFTWPKDVLPKPDLILTGRENYSVQAGKILNEYVKSYYKQPAQIKEKWASVNPETLTDTAAIKDYKHLVVIGSESKLALWTRLFAKKTNNERTEHSPLCILKDGQVSFDITQLEGMYAFDTIMDSLLLQQVNETPENKLPFNLRKFNGKIRNIIPIHALRKAIEK